MGFSFILRICANSFFENFNMFPFYRPASEKDKLAAKDKPLSEQICPLGCLCCIMQQFYNRKCWCQAVKESIGTQTEFNLADCSISDNNLTDKHTPKVTMVTTSTQTDEDLTNYGAQINEISNSDVKKRELFDSTKSNTRHTYVLPGKNKQYHGIEEDSFDLTEDHNPYTATLDHADSMVGTEPVYLSDLKETMHYSSMGIQKIKRMRKSAESQHVLPLKMFQLGDGISSQDTSLSSVRARHSLSSTHGSLDYANDIGRDNLYALKVDQTSQRYFTNGTSEYNIMQNAICKIVEKYELTGARDANFEIALQDVFSEFPVLNDDVYTHKTVRDKLRHKISSRRHYDRIKTEAGAIGIGVSLLKRRRMQENALQNKLIGDTVLHNSFHNLIHTSNIPLSMSSQTPTSSIKSEDSDVEDALTRDLLCNRTIEGHHRQEDTFRIKIEPVDNDDAIT